MSGVEDIEIKQGSDFSKGWLARYNGELIDDTWTAKAQIRPSASSPVLLHEFNATVDADGSVVIGVPASDSWDWDWRNGKYDVLVTNADSTLTLRVKEGNVTVTSGVTR